MTYLSLRIIVNENFETYLSVLNTVYVLDTLINSKVKAYIFRYYYEGEHVTLKKPCYVLMRDGE